MPEVYWCNPGRYVMEQGYGDALSRFRNLLLRLDCKYEQSSSMTLWGRLLLCFVMEMKYHAGWENKLRDIVYSSKGKPFFASSSDGFSISHSGKYVALAFLKNNKVGIDIQRAVEMKPHLAEMYLHPEEKKVACKFAGVIAQKAFLAWIWSRKEAVVKFTGEGICFSGLKRMNVLHNEVSAPGFGTVALHSEMPDNGCVISIACLSSSGNGIISQREIACEVLEAFVQSSCTAK